MSQWLNLVLFCERQSKRAANCSQCNGTLNLATPYFRYCYLPCSRKKVMSTDKANPTFFFSIFPAMNDCNSLKAEDHLTNDCYNWRSRCVKKSDLGFSASMMLH